MILNKLMKNSILFISIVIVVLIGYAFWVFLLFKGNLNQNVEFPYINLVDIINSVLLIIAGVCMSTIFYNRFGDRFKSDILAKIIAVLIPVCVYPVFLSILVFIISGDANLEYIFVHQLTPDFASINYYLDTEYLFYKTSGVFMYLVYGLKNYIAAAIFLILNRKNIPVIANQTLYGESTNPIENYQSSSENTSIQTSLDATSTLPTFCPNCGTPVTGTGIFCSSCGKPLTSTAPTQSVPNSSGYAYFQPHPADKNSVGMNVLAFFMPLVGLILYVVWISQLPIKAKGVGKWALIGFLTNIILVVLFYASIISIVMNNY